MGDQVKKAGDQITGMNPVLAGTIASNVGLGGAGGAVVTKELTRRQDKEAADQRKKAFSDFLAGQREEQQGIQSLFSGMKGPTATSGELQQALSGVGRVGDQGAVGRGIADVNFLRGIAQSEGTTEAGKRLLAEQEAIQSGRIGDIQEGAAQARANQLSQMSQFGGAGAGARERLAAQGQSNALREEQRERRAGAEARLGLMSQDEMRKLQLAQALPGQEAGLGSLAANVSGANVDAQMRSAALGQQARQFDVAAQQAAQKFRIGKQADLRQQALQQQGQLFGSGQLADLLEGQANQGGSMFGPLSNIFGGR